MQSASLENPAEALVGVDPTDTRVVAIGGARFTLGVMTAEVWEDISVELLELRSNAIPKAIKALADKGLDPDGKTEEGHSLLMIEMFKDKTFTRAIGEAYLKALAHTLRGVEGFVNSAGVPLHFAIANGKLTDFTIDVYRRNMRITERLWSDIADMNTLGGLAKKR